MPETTDELTVMFADVADSTHLYELMGDENAKELISNTLDELSVIVSEHNGKTIKTIGDEIMCGFPTADNAVIAAKEMHELLADKTVPAQNYNLVVRVGAHHGSVINSGGDIFGDTVNISAGVVSLSRAGKTLITEHTYKQLPPSLQENCRHIMQTMVKGKEQPINIYDVVWEQNDELTSVISHTNVRKPTDVLALKYQDTVINMSATTVTSLTMGRGTDCDLVIPAPLASRMHCKITFNLDKFIFTDHSTNGTYIQHDGIELFFHQEKSPLSNSGVISFGGPCEKNKDFLLEYAIQLSTG